MTKQKLDVVLDLETVQDTELLPADYPKDKFAHPVAHRVVSLSMATFKREDFPDDETLQIRSLGSARGSEAQILTSFVKYVEKMLPRVAGFNIRGFDMEVIKIQVPKSWDTVSSILPDRN